MQILLSKEDYKKMTQLHLVNCFFWKVICHFCGVVGLLTFIVVVLHCDYTTSGCPGVVNDGFGVQGFDGERVDHTDVDSLWGRREEGGGCTKLIWTDAPYEKLYFFFKHYIINKSHKAQYIVQNLCTDMSWFVFLCLACSVVSTFLQLFSCS